MDEQSIPTAVERPVELSAIRMEQTMQAMRDESVRELERMTSVAASRRRINMMRMEPTR